MNPLHYLKSAFSMPAINFNASSFDSAVVRTPSIESLSAQLEADMMTHGAPDHVQIPRQTLHACAESLIRQTDALKSDLLAGLSAKELKETVLLEDTTEKLLKDGGDIKLTTTPGTEQHGLAIHLRQVIQRLPAADYLERGGALLDFAGAVLANDPNESTSNAARHAGTALSVVMRTGTLVVLTTLLRQMVGFALESNFQKMGEHASFTPRMISGIASLLIGPGLNLIGGVRDECNGSATTVSRAARLAMGLISIGGLCIASAYDPVDVVGYKMSSIGPQLAAYTLSRDLIQVLFPLHDNGGINANGLLYSSLMYGIAQMLLGEGMMTLAPQSGAEYVMSQAGRLAEGMASWATAAGVTATMIEPNYIHDLIKSCLNAMVEIFDDIQRPAWMHYFSGDSETDAMAAETGSLSAQWREMALGDESIDDSEHEYPSLSRMLSPPFFTQKQRVDHASTMTLRSQAVGGNTASFEHLPRQRAGLRIGLDPCRVGAGRWPTRAQFADQMLTTCAMRTSVFEAVVGIAVTVAAALSETDLPKSTQAHFINLLVGGLVMVGYPAFVAAHLVKPPGEDATSQDGGEGLGREMLTTKTLTTSTPPSV